MKMISIFENKIPRIDPTCFLAPGSQVIGDVVMGAGSSLWFNSIIRGDVNLIRIGRSTNIQDLTMVHVTSLEAPQPSETHIGDEVTIGHRVMIHGCSIGNRALIGMGAILLDGVEIGEEAVIGAGSLVTQNTRIPAGSLAFGAPAKVIRALSSAERQALILSAKHYESLAKKYLTAPINSIG